MNDPRTQTRAALEALLAATDPKRYIGMFCIQWVQANADGTEARTMTLEAVRTGAVEKRSNGTYFATLSVDGKPSGSYDLADLAAVIAAVFDGRDGVAPLWPERKASE